MKEKYYETLTKLQDPELFFNTVKEGF